MTPALLTDTVTPDLARAVHYALIWGLEGVALRTVGGAGNRVPFVNEAALRQRLDDADLPVVLLDPGLFEGPVGARAAWLNDTDALADTLAFAGRIGAPLVRVGALAADIDSYSPEAVARALRPAADVAARTGVRLAVANAAGTAVATAAHLADLLAAIGHPAVGADWHPGEARAAGEGPEAVAALATAPGGIVAVSVDDAFANEHPGAWLRALAGWEGPLVLSVAGRPAGRAGLDAATALIGAVRAAR